MKIRIDECGGGNPPTTTTTTSRSNPGTSGPRYLIERCSDSANYYVDASIYCDSGSEAVIPGGTFSVGDIVQFQLSTNCSGATYCGEIISSSTGTFTGRMSSSAISPSCQSLLCFE